MISGSSSVDSLIPGNPAAISSVLERVGAGVSPAKAVSTAWQAMSLPGWTGRAAAQWESLVPREAARAGRAPAAFGRVAAAMLAYQSAFLVARSEIEAAIRDAATAEQTTANALQTHRTALSKAALAKPGTPEATVAAFSDPGAAGLASAHARVVAAQAVFARQADVAAAEIRSAAGQTSNEKPGIEWWDQIFQFPGRFVEGFILQGVDTLVGLWELVDLPGLFDAMGKGMDPSMFYALKGATTAYAIAQDPGAAVEGVVREFFAADHWDGYAGEGVGRVGFNILSLFSGGAGAVRGLKFLKDLKAPKASEGGSVPPIRPESLSPTQINSSIEVLKTDSKLLSNKNGLRQYEREGGFSQAEQDFAELTRGLEIEIKENGTHVAKLPDGSVANVRLKSSGGMPTLEIKRPSGTSDIKFRYKD